MVRENISGRFQEWRREIEAFEGSSADMLRFCLKVWWDRVGATKASGINKLIISEARNFPDIAAFYQDEVIKPVRGLIRLILQRGVDRGEFSIVDMDYAQFSVMAPMIFLTMMKHSLGACVPQGYPIDPERYIASQLDTLLHGLCVRAEDKQGRTRR